jgi:hypothetical protein
MTADPEDSPDVKMADVVGTTLAFQVIVQPEKNP